MISGLKGEQPVDEGGKEGKQIEYSMCRDDFYCEHLALDSPRTY